MTETTLSFSRRESLRGMFAASALSLLPFKVRAQGWEEAAAAVGVVVGVMDSINKARASRELRAQLSQINAKLDALIAGQHEILDEIQRLKLYISDALFKQFRDSAEIELNSLKNRYDFVTAGGFRRSRALDYARLSDDIQDKTNSLGQYDFGAFYSFAVGVSMAMVLRRTLGTPEVQLAALKAGFKSKTDGWLDPQNDRGVTRALEFAGGDIEKAKAQLNAYPREIVIGSRVRFDGDEACPFSTYLTLTGDLNTPFTGTTREVKGKCITRNTDHGPHCRECVAQPTLKAFGTSVAKDDVPDYSGIPTPLNDDRSPFPQAREANHLRNVVIDALKRERDLRYVEGQIRRASAILAA